MFVVRLLTAGALAYAGLRLRKYLSQSGQVPQTGAGDEAPLEDILVEDPVCHRLVPQKQALTLIHAGTYHYFCSDGCRTTFQQLREQRA